jgi:uncharacterized sulfatase
MTPADRKDPLMGRTRSLLTRTANLIALLAGAGALAAAPPIAARTPNVVLLISDDQAWTDFGFMGHPLIRTPRLDHLASESAVFPRGYVPSSLCRPSLATIITGLYPHQHRITGNDPPKGTPREAMLRHIEAAATLPKLLGARGYRSLQTGKWWEGDCRCGGFSEGMTHGDPEDGGRHGDEGLDIGRKTLEPIFDFVDDCGATPFFLWYAPFLPHTPHNPPARLLEKYRSPERSIHVARYQAMCEWFDETCGRILDHLDKKGLTESTLVLFLADNGWIQDPERAVFAPRSKASPYDGGLRTPILLKWPGRVKPGRYEALAASIDVAPTVLAACGVAPPAGLPGLDLVALSRGGGPDRSAVFGATFTHDVVDIDRPAKNVLYRWGVEASWKLIWPVKPEAEPELYDLAADPLELKDRAADEPERVERLKRLIDGWWAARE